MSYAGINRNASENGLKGFEEWKVYSLKDCPGNHDVLLCYDDNVTMMMTMTMTMMMILEKMMMKSSKNLEHDNGIGGFGDVSNEYQFITIVMTMMI